MFFLLVVLDICRIIGVTTWRLLAVSVLQISAQHEGFVWDVVRLIFLRPSRHLNKEDNLLIVIFSQPVNPPNFRAEYLQVFGLFAKISLSLSLSLCSVMWSNPSDFLPKPTCSTERRGRSRLTIFTTLVSFTSTVVPLFKTFYFIWHFSLPPVNHIKKHPFPSQMTDPMLENKP